MSSILPQHISLFLRDDNCGTDAHKGGVVEGCGNSFVHALVTKIKITLIQASPEAFVGAQI